MTAVARLVRSDEFEPDRADPRDPDLYRPGLASARAALREGVGRRHRRVASELDADGDGQDEPERRDDAEDREDEA